MKFYVILFIFIFSGSVFSANFTFTNQTAALAQCESDVLADPDLNLWGNSAWCSLSDSPYPNDTIYFLLTIIGGNNGSQHSYNFTVWDIVTCNVGDLITKSTLFMSSSGLTRTINIGSAVKYNVAGCEYVQDFTNTDSAVCNEDANKDIYCNVAMISSGNTTVIPLSNDAVISNTNLVDSDGCITVNSITSCPTPLDDSCYTINGSKVCTDTNSNTVEVDGVTVTDTDHKNCVQGSDGLVCIATTDSPKQDIVLNDTEQASTAPLNNDLRNFTDTTVVTNPDSSITTTTTTSSNVVDSNDHITETITQPDGSSSITESDTNKENIPNEGEEEEYTPTTTEPDTSATGTAIDSFFDASESLLTSNEFNETSNFINFSLPDLSGSCTPLTLSATTSRVNVSHVVDPCTKLAPFRDLFGYFLYIITGIALVHVVTKTSTM